VDIKVFFMFNLYNILHAKPIRSYIMCTSTKGQEVTVSGGAATWKR